MDMKLSAQAKEFVPNLSTEPQLEVPKDKTLSEKCYELSAAVPEFIPQNRNGSSYDNSFGLQMQYDWQKSYFPFNQYNWNPQLLGQKVQGQGFGSSEFKGQKFQHKRYKQMNQYIADRSTKFAANAGFESQKYTSEAKTDSFENEHKFSHTKKSSAKSRGPGKNMKQSKDEPKRNSDVMQDEDLNLLQPKGNTKDTSFRLKNDFAIQHEDSQFKRNKRGKQKFEKGKPLIKNEDIVTSSQYDTHDDNNISLTLDQDSKDIDERPKDKRCSTLKGQGRNTGNIPFIRQRYSDLSFKQDSRSKDEYERENVKYNSNLKSHGHNTETEPIHRQGYPNTSFKQDSRSKDEYERTKDKHNSIINDQCHNTVTEPFHRKGYSNTSFKQDQRSKDKYERSKDKYEHNSTLNDSMSKITGHNSTLNDQGSNPEIVSFHRKKYSDISVKSRSRQNSAAILGIGAPRPNVFKGHENNNTPSEIGSWADSTMEAVELCEGRGTTGVSWSKIVQQGFVSPSSESIKVKNNVHTDKTVGSSYSNLHYKNDKLGHRTEFKGYHQEAKHSLNENIKLKIERPKSRDLNKHENWRDGKPLVLAGIGRGRIAVDLKRQPIECRVGKEDRYHSEVKKSTTYNNEHVSDSIKQSQDNHLERRNACLRNSNVTALSQSETRTTLGVLQATKETVNKNNSHSDDGQWEYVQKKIRKNYFETRHDDKLDEIERQRFPKANLTRREDDELRKQQSSKEQSEMGNANSRNGNANSRSRLDTNWRNRDNSNEIGRRDIKRESDGRNSTRNVSNYNTEFREARPSYKRDSALNPQPPSQNKTDSRQPSTISAAEPKQSKARKKKVQRKPSFKPRPIDDEQQKIKEYKMRQMIEDSLKDNLVQMKSSKQDASNNVNERLAAASFQDENEWPSVGLSTVISAPVISYSAVLRKAAPPQLLPTTQRRPESDVLSDVLEVDSSRLEMTEEEKRKCIKAKRKQKKKDKKQRQKAEKEPSGLLPPQAKSKLINTPITLDIGSLFDKLLKTSLSTPERGQSRSNKAVMTRNLLSTGVVSVVSGLAKKNTAGGRKKEINKGKISSNPLDSHQPVKMRGKEREVPKKKKSTLLKKIIMRERQKKLKEREMKERELKQQKLNVDKGKNVVDSEDTNLENKENCEKNDTEEAENSNSLNEPGICEEENKVNVEELKKCKPLTNLPEAVIKRLHTRKFREYCDHFLSKEIDDMVRQLLVDLQRFQERAVRDNPIKAKTKRRYVLGIREVIRHLKMKRLKCVIVAPNLERIASEGGIDDYLGNILALCNTVNTPTFFAMTRQGLGRVFKKKVPISVIGIFNYDGAQDIYKDIMHEVAQSKERYQLKVQELLSGNIEEETPFKSNSAKNNRDKHNNSSNKNQGQGQGQGREKDRGHPSQRQANTKHKTDDKFLSASETQLYGKNSGIPGILVSKELFANVKHSAVLADLRQNKYHDSSDWETDNSDNE